MELIKLVIDKSQQETTFPDTTVTDNDDFDMRLILIHLSLELIDNIISDRI